ncbi:hypothetical protein BDW22DRAFT_291452 [Trametopsis cervina]|nr:hypothetical protein BDW22DRAFT_291452 [Trametopsis cervina]
MQSAHILHNMRYLPLPICTNELYTTLVSHDLVVLQGLARLTCFLRSIITSRCTLFTALYHTICSSRIVSGVLASYDLHRNTTAHKHSALADGIDVVLSQTKFRTCLCTYLLVVEVPCY